MGNKKILELLSRITAICKVRFLKQTFFFQSQDDFLIVTGTYGVLKLTIGKTQRDIYLAPNNKLRVPEQFWKIVYHKKSQSAIVIITSNNPYATVQPLCADVCKTYGWWHENFQQEINKRRGLTYCCTYKDFKEVVTYAPSLTIRGTYKMPSEYLCLSTFLTSGAITLYSYFKKI